MDVARAPQKKTGRNAMIAGGVLLLIVLTIVFARLRPAAPTVEAATMYMDSVRRGDMVRDVRGPGSLVPEHITWISAQANARVDKLVAESGQKVKTGDILLELSNPDQQIQALNAEQSLSAAEAALVNLTTQLHSGTLSQEGVVATTNTQYVQARQDAMAADTLLAKKLISPFDYNNKKALADELTQRVRIERERLALMRQTVDSQISVQRQQVKRLRDIAKFQEAILASLSVRSPDTGVLQDLTLQPGQWVTSGTMLAKVVEPGKLKAQLRIPETQAKDVQIGQKASIDTRNGIIPGHVSRKDPSSVAGTVLVDVALDGALPAGAVPDLSVDGTIVIEQLKNVLFTGRPASGAGTGPVGIFKVVENGSAAIRVQVLLGRSSVNLVEVVRGLNVGDKVILSDMSQWDNVERVRLK
ncbi:MAG TPA: HlyD family efflux transporter periplasmic adaptor subunit [Gemmatimonadaceae bacterium]